MICVIVARQRLWSEGLGLLGLSFGLARCCWVRGKLGLWLHQFTS